jgi:hypothetical protein
VAFEVVSMSGGQFFSDVWKTKQNCLRFYDFLKSSI